MERARQSRAWWRLAAALTFGLALVAVPAVATTGNDPGNPAAGLAQMAPVTAHAVDAVLRAAPATIATASHTSTGSGAAVPAVAVTVAALGWLVVRRHGRNTPATRLPAAVAARAPPSTVGF